MATPLGYGMNGRAFFTNVAKPINVNMTFTVASGNGLGVTSLKSNGHVNNVFMHTSITPTSNNGTLNPNPQSGYALIQLKNNFNVYLNCFSSLIPPLTSTGTTSLTSKNVYVITSLGTTTAAQWLTAGLPAGLSPTVGQAFVAAATASIGGSGTVGIPGVPVIDPVSVVGDPSKMLSNSNIASNGGGLVMVQFAAATSSSVTTMIPAAPADGSIVSLSLWLDGSAVTVDGL